MKSMVLLCLEVFLACLMCVHGKVGKKESHSRNETSLENKALFLADYLVNNPDLFNKLLAVGKSATGLASKSTDASRFQSFGNYLMDQLPMILGTPETAAIANILVDEFESINDTSVKDEVGEYARQNNINDSEILQNLGLKLTLKLLNIPRTVQRILTSQSARHYLPLTTNSTINNTCYNDMMNFWDALRGVQFPPRSSLNYTMIPWAIKMFDSYGKLRGGVTKGAGFWLGSHDMCQSIKAELPAGVFLGNRTLSAPVNFTGKYCRARFAIPETVPDSFDLDIQDVDITLDWGICVSDSCTSGDIAQMFDLGLMENITALKANVSCDESKKVVEDSKALMSLFVIGVLVLITVTCTVIDAVLDWMKDNIDSKNSFQNRNKEINSVVPMEKLGQLNPGFTPDSGEGVYKSVQDDGQKFTPDEKPQNDVTDKSVLPSTLPVLSGHPYTVQGSTEDRLFMRLIKAFSFYTNMPKLMNGDKNPNDFHCLHGIRFFSLLWLILFHTYIFGIFLDSGTHTVVDGLDMIGINQRFSQQAVLAAFYAVDTFFVLSGFLVCHRNLKDLTKKKLSLGYVAHFYYHRYLRLTPIYAVIMMVFACLFDFMVDGPLWSGHLNLVDYCRSRWWSNLLYINNFIHPREMCMQWTWYLAVDVQLYIIAPIFILLLHFKPVAGVILTVCTMCAGIATAFNEEMKYPADLFGSKDIPEYFTEVYVTPWCRVAPYCVGLLLGFVVFKVKKGTLKNLPALAGWFITFAVGVTLCYVTYDRRGEGQVPWTSAEMAVYESLGRPLWALCVAWIVFACHQGKGGFINTILSNGGFIPFSRMTYAVYLVHPIMMLIHIFNKRALVSLGDYYIAYLYVGHTVCSYMAAFWLTLMFEMPFFNLEKIFFPR